MFAVELRSTSGEELQLGNGKKVSFSIPAQSKSKPATIGLWSFDESKGRWKEEGIPVTIIIRVKCLTFIFGTVMLLSH